MRIQGRAKSIIIITSPITTEEEPSFQQQKHENEKIRDFKFGWMFILKFNINNQPETRETYRFCALILYFVKTFDFPHFG